MRKALIIIILAISPAAIAQQVELLTADNCRYCVLAKAWLNARMIEYTERKIEGQVPQLAINGRVVIVGFSSSAYEAEFAKISTKPKAKAIANDYRLSAVRIKNQTTQGTGVVITKGPRGVVLSCAHLFQGRIGGSVEVFFSDGSKATAFLRAHDKSRDLALLELDESARPPGWAPVAEKPKPGTVVSVGFPNGIGPKLRTLRFLRSLRTTQGNHEWFQYTPTEGPRVEGGDSGGPVFAKGQVVGLTTTSGTGQMLGRIRLNVGDSIGPSHGEIVQYMQSHFDLFKRHRDSSGYRWLRPNFETPAPKSNPPAGGRQNSSGDCACNVDYEKLLELLAKDERFRGPQGPPGLGIQGEKGEAGPQGEQGFNGIDGTDGRTPTPEELAALITGQMPEEYVSNNGLLAGIASTIAGGGLAGLIATMFLNGKINKFGSLFEAMKLFGFNLGGSSGVTSGGTSGGSTVNGTTINGSTQTVNTSTGQVPIHTHKVRTHQNIVNSPVGNEELLATVEAMKKIEEGKPGTRGTMHAIRSVRDQILSGMNREP